MYVGDVLVALGLATPEDVGMALEMQRVAGGAFGSILARISNQSEERLGAIIDAAPAAPRTVADTGLQLADLLGLLARAIFVAGEMTPSAVMDTLKLAPRVIDMLIVEADERRLLELRAPGRFDTPAEPRYGLTDKGVRWAQEAMSRCQYVGPAPVTLAAFRDRVSRQRIANEHITREMIDEAFADLVVSEHLVRKIGPAVNSGKSVLLYGPCGDGKTAIGERIGRIFKDIIYIPYCFEVDGQIIKVFDPALHQPIRTRDRDLNGRESLRREPMDMRWVACRRPFVITGGELNLEMLDLSFNTIARFYEAPLHIKALGGVCMVDDFGRQLISPTALLNRWIVPMESRVEYLKLHTGKSFSLPFDELVIFSTNLSPAKLMDPAFLRRIPYKIPIQGPSAEEFRLIFRRVLQKAGFPADERLIDAIMIEIRDRNGMPLAGYQPKFIIDQVLAAARFEGVEASMKPELVAMALGNLIGREGLAQDTPCPVRQSNEDVPAP